MALTEEQEKSLLAAVPALQKQLGDLAPIAAKVPELETKLAAKDAEILALKNGQAALSQQSEINGLKTAYPNVPKQLLEHVLTLPADKREAILKPVQEAASVKTPIVKTDGMEAWADVGSISPSSETEAAAARAQAEKDYETRKGSGAIMGMLELRGAELSAHIRRALAPSK